MICDFCSSPHVIGGYPTQDFEIIGFGSTGNFAACPECKELVDTGNRESLLKRSVETFQQIFGCQLDPGTVAAVAELHRAFFEFRNGPFEAFV
jgi:hypothetical protein